MIGKCAIFLCFVAVSRQLSISEFEVPNAVKAGEDAELRCQYKLLPGEYEADLFVKWWLTSLDSEGDRSQLYQRGPGTPGIALKSNILIKNNDTIVLDNVSPTDSGIYECEVSTIDEVRKHQELIVYTEGSGPELNVSTVSDGPDEDTEEDVLLECEATDVAPLPDFIVTVNGEEVEMSESVIGPDQDGLYDIFANVTLTKDTVDGADIRCELIYMNTNVTHPPYIDTEIYDPSGALTTTQLPEDSTPPDTTSESLQDDSDTGNHLRLSWSLLLGVGALSLLNLY